jgi:MFS family permease
MHAPAPALPINSLIPPAPAELSTLRRAVAFATMCLGCFIAYLDIQIVSASIQEVGGGLSASQDELSWIQTSYLIPEIIVIPLTGWLSRVMSTHWLVAVSAFGFTVASVLCSVAWDMRSMIVFRALQGFFGGSMIPTAFTAAVILFQGRQKAIAASFDGIRSATRQYLFGTAFMPRPSGYGGWRVQVPRRDYVRGMEFLQGIGSKTGAMPPADDLMYIFHIRPETADAAFRREDYASLLRDRLSQYGSYVAEVAASLNANSDIVYSPIEPILVPWPWFRGRVVIGGDAAHTSPPHLTQGAA